MQLANLKVIQPKLEAFRPQVYHRALTVRRGCQTVHWKNLCTKQRSFSDNIWRTSHQTDEGDKRLFRWIRAQGPWRRHARLLEKSLRTHRHSPKNGRLRRQALNLTPLKGVKTWGHGTLGLTKLTVWHGYLTVRWKTSARSRRLLGLTALKKHEVFWYRKLRSTSHYTTTHLSDIYLPTHTHIYIYIWFAN